MKFLKFFFLKEKSKKACDSKPQVVIGQRFECQKNHKEKNGYKHRRTSSRPLIYPSETDQGLPQR
jgi:hypothetical protein